MKAIKTLLKVELAYKKKELFFDLFLTNFKGSTEDLKEVDEYIATNLVLKEIVDDYGPIVDWTVLSVESTDDQCYEGSVNQVEDPEIAILEALKLKLKEKKDELQRLKEEKQNKIVSNFEENLESYSVEKKHIKTDLKKGLFTIKNKAFGKVEIPIMSIYALIEKNTENDFDLVNSFGDKILSLNHGSFLNAGLADIQVFDSSEKMESDSLMNPTSKGGIFVRDNGTLHVGDIDRTKFLVVDIAALIKEMYMKGMINSGSKFLENLKIN